MGVYSMITIRIPESVQSLQLFDLMKEYIQQGIRSFELNIRGLNGKDIFICSNPESSTEYNQLDDILKDVKQLNKNIQLILNLLDPNIEVQVKARVEKWDLKKQVKYTGKVNPNYLTPWDRMAIYYNVENSLPNFYQLGVIKKAHFDVIHYFCRKYKVKTLRLNVEALSEDLLYWAKKHDLMLSVVGIKTQECAQELLNKGITQVTTTDVSLFGVNSFTGVENIKPTY